MGQTVKDTKGFFTICQVSQAKRARELLHVMHCPSIADLKWIIKMNSIKNCPVTTEDIDLTKKIWRTWCSILKEQYHPSKPSSSCEWCYWNTERTNCKSIQCWPMHRYYVCELTSILDHRDKNQSSSELVTISQTGKKSNTRWHWQRSFADIQMLALAFTVLSVIRNFNKYSSIFK